jgi:hypothetical protein
MPGVHGRQDAESCRPSCGLKVPGSHSLGEGDAEPQSLPAGQIMHVDAFVAPAAPL